jgi:N-methylhydantoinase A
MAFEFVRSSPDIIDDGVLSRAARIRAEMRDEGARLLRASGVSTHAITFEESADMRYVGQGFELRVPIADDGSSVADAFRSAYQRKYGRTGPDVPLEVLSWRVVARGVRPHLPLSSARQSERTAAVVKGRREVWLAGRGFETVPVIDRYALRPGVELAGPAIVEERESTLVVPDASTCTVGEDLSLTIALEGQ